MVYIQKGSTAEVVSVQILHLNAHDGSFSLLSIIKWHELQCLTDFRDERYSMYVHDTCKQESVKAAHKCSIGETLSLQATY